MSRNYNDEAAYAAGTTALFQSIDWSYLNALDLDELQAMLATSPRSQRQRAEQTAIRQLLGIELADSWEDDN